MRLADWLKQNDIKVGIFADRIGASQAAVSRYVNNLRIPRPDQMAAIVRETEGAVTPNDFYAHLPPANAASEAA